MGSDDRDNTFVPSNDTGDYMDMSKRRSSTARKRGSAVDSGPVPKPRVNYLANKQRMELENIHGTRDDNYALFTQPTPFPRERGSGVNTPEDNYVQFAPTPFPRARSTRADASEDVYDSLDDEQIGFNKTVDRGSRVRPNAPLPRPNIKINEQPGISEDVYDSLDEVPIKKKRGTIKKLTHKFNKVISGSSNKISPDIGIGNSNLPGRLSSQDNKVFNNPIPEDHEYSDYDLIEEPVKGKKRGGNRLTKIVEKVRSGTRRDKNRHSDDTVKLIPPAPPPLRDSFKGGQIDDGIYMTPHHDLESPPPLPRWPLPRMESLMHNNEHVYEELPESLSPPALPPPRNSGGPKEENTYVTPRDDYRGIMPERTLPLKSPTSSRVERGDPVYSNSSMGTSSVFYETPNNSSRGHQNRATTEKPAIAKKPDLGRHTESVLQTRARSHRGDNHLSP